MKKLCTTVFFAFVIAMMLLLVSCDSMNRTGPVDASNLEFEEMILQNSPVATVNDTELGTGIVTLMIAGAQQTIEAESPELSGEEYSRAVLEKAVEHAAILAVVQSFANQHNIELTQDDIDEFTAGIDMTVAMYGEEAFAEMLTSYGYVSMEHLMTTDIIYVLADKVITMIMEDSSMFAQFEAHMEEQAEEEILGAKHILVAFEATEIEFAEGEEGYEEAYEAAMLAYEASIPIAEVLAMELWARAVAGEDFDALIAEYGEDLGMEASPNGYSFVSGAMVQEFEEATRNLQIGEISEPVRTTYGFHIILRIEPDRNPENISRPWWDPGPPTLEQLMSNAIVTGFDEMTQNADIVFLPALYNIPVN
ncbi:MAG: peptidylprolyl isomerase [Clostridiales bacterium]|jgi:parvulin-like peptidyl-prolyl isomerase|nr:peptidylprolyl isomerase [Clostridiales bacterium]